MEFLKEHSFVIAQLIGFCAMATAIISFQQKKRKNIMLFQFICTVFWTLHFFVLGNMTGGVINAIQVLRCVVFAFKGKYKWAEHNVWLIVFLVSSIIAGVLTWEGLHSILPIVGMIFSTVALWMKNPKYIRLLTIPVAVSWFIFNIFSKSYAGMCNEVLALISILTALWRLDRRKKEEV